MVSSSSKGWLELRRPTKSTCPRLFYNYYVEENGLTIRLTDLVAIWQCSLNRMQIVEAASAQHSSIDPSESNAQLHVLLEKLEQSLKSGDNLLSRDRDIDVQKVYLKTVLRLPKPLKPLVWTFALIPQDAGELAEQILRPCLHEASVVKQKLDSLIRVIKNKDHVLSRLLEKVDSSAIDLSLIFPGTTGLRQRKGRVSVQEAQKHVPGMAEFDIERWLQGFENESPYASFDQMGINNLVAGCEKCPKHTVKQHDNWYQKLPTQGNQVNTKVSESTKSSNHETPESCKDNESTDSESDFQRQPTPPHLRKTSNHTKAGTSTYNAKEAASSEDEGQRPKKRAKLGQLGGPHDRSRIAQPPNETSSSSVGEPEATELRPQKSAAQVTKQKKNQASDSDTETASESEILLRKSTTDSQSVATPATENKHPKSLKGHRLGKLTPKSPQKRPPSTRSNQSSRDNTEIRSPSRSQHRSQADSLQPKRAQRSSKSESLNNGTDSELEMNATVSRDQPAKRKSATQTNNNDSDTETASDNNDNGHTPSPSKLNPIRERSPSENPSTPRHKLGRLKASRSHSHDSLPISPQKSKKVTATVPEPNPQHNDTSFSSTATTNPETKREKQTPDPASSSPVPEPSPKKRETAAEAADRRRAELKAKLNSGGGVGGVTKKKRKF